MIRTRGVSHVELPVDDVDRSTDFYSNVFGFEVVHRRNGRALLQTPGAPGSLALQQASAPAPRGVTHFGLELVDAADLDAAIALAVANGGVVLARTAHPAGGATVVIGDPTGHRITL